MSWVRTYWACWTWSISKKDFKLWGNTKSFMCFSSSSHSAHGFQDYDPDKGFPTAVKWDANWKMISSGTRLNVTSAQSIAIRFWTILLVLPVTIPSFFFVFIKDVKRRQQFLPRISNFNSPSHLQPQTSLHFIWILEQDESIWPI